jgi:hypothetical protein
MNPHSIRFLCFVRDCFTLLKNACIHRLCKDVIVDRTANFGLVTGLGKGDT